MAKKKNKLQSFGEYTQNNPSYAKKSVNTFENYQKIQEEQKRRQEEQKKQRQQQNRELSRQQTAAWQKAYQDAKYSPDGVDRSYQVYAAKLMSETPGALEKEQERQRRLSTAETQKMQKLVQDLTYGYNKTYGPELAYQAAQTGVKADQVRGLVDQDYKVRNSIDQLSREYNALNGLTYQGVKDERQKNKTGYNYTLQQDFDQRAKNRANQAEGLLDNGNDPFYMSTEGRKAYRDSAAQTAEELRAKIKEYEAFDPDAARSGLYEKFYQKDLANEQAILDNPVYKGTPFETTAQARKAELESGYNAGWREATERADRLLAEGKITLEGKTPEEQRQIRQMVYDSIMPDSYKERTKTRRDLEETNAIIDEYINSLNETPWGSGSQGEAIDALERQAKAYESQVEAADNAQKYYDFMDRNRVLADGMDLNTGYDESLLPALPKMIYNQSADDFIPEPQGDEIDKAYWYANNWQNMGNYKDNMLGFESKYMFIASDPEMLAMFNEFYAKDKENQLDRLHGLKGTNYAEMFLKGLEPYLSTMLVDYQDKKIRSMSENPVSGIPMRILSPVMQAAGGVAGTLGAITGQGKDSSAYLMTRIASAVRSQQNEDVGDWVNRVFGGGGDVAQFMLGVVDSIADNVFAMGTGTALAGQGTKGAMRLVQLIMSGSATSNKMIESLDKNMDPTEAALYAVGDGVIEWLTERYSLEQIMGPDVRQLFGNKRAMASFIARSAAAEGSEEIASDLLNMGLDSVLSLVYGHEDELTARYNELVTQYKMSDEEASRTAIEEKLREIGLSGLAGALSGLGMAGSRVVSTALETGRQGQNIQTQSGGMDSILKLAQQMKEGTESRSLADQLSAEIEKGSEVSNYDLGRLANLTALDVGEARSQVIQETVDRNVMQQLRDAGMTEDQAKQYGSIITRSIMEGKLPSKADMRTLSQDERAIRLWTDFNTMSQASRNLIKDIKTETKPLDSIADKVGELVTPEAEQQSAAAEAVVQSMRESSSMEEAIDNLQAKNTGLMSEGYAELAKQVLQENPEVQKSQGYLDDIMKIRLAAMTGDRMPKTKLDSEIAQRFFDAAKNEFDEEDQSRVVPQAPAQEGQGVATYNGAEYGTQAWKDATQGLSKFTRNVMGAVGEVAARFGHKVILVNDPENPDVYGFEDANTGAITINVANGFKHHMLVTLAHEMTHWLEQNSRGGYNDLRSFVLDGLRAQGVNVQERIVKIMDNYNMVMKPEAGKGMTINQAMAELVAQSSEALLSSRRAAVELQNTNPGLYSKVKSYVQNIVARIDNAIQDMEYERSLSYEAQALKKYRDQIADIWFNARKDAQGNTPAERAEEQAEGEKSYSIRNKDGEEVKLTEKEIETNKTTISNMETVANIKQNNFLKGDEDFKTRALDYFQKNGNVAVNKTFGEVEINESGLKHLVSYLTARRAGLLEAIIPVIENGEIIRVDDKGIIHNFDSAIIAAPVEYMGKPYYMGVVIKQNENAQNNLYYMHDAVAVPIEKGLSPANKRTTERPLGDNPSIANILQSIPAYNGKSGNRSFSLANAVEERQDGLVAVHNLEEGNLIKALNLGGFAMPSIAIIKNDNPYNKYGKISVVFGPDTIDPKAYRTNKVYGGDAWTPVYPKVEYKLNSKKLEKILSKIRELLPERFKHANLVDLYEVNLSEAVNRYKGAEDISNAIGNEGMNWLRLAYMMDTGKEVEYPTKIANLSERFDNEQVIHIANMLGQDLVEEATKDDPWDYAVKHPELVEEIRQELNEQYRNKLPEDSRFRKFDIYNENNYGSVSVEYLLRGAKKYFQKGMTETIDIDALNNTLKETIDETDFKNWLNNLFSGIIQKSGIRNNKDYYTNAGNPRSWEQLHDEETLDNVVRIMREQDDKGENAFFGQSAILAQGTRNFKSLDEVREHKDQLQVLDEEDYSNLKHNIVDQFSELMDQLYDRRESNIFIARDRVIEAIADAVKGSRTVANITKVMNQWGFHPSQAQAQKIADLMVEISNLPTEYFEAKPQRAVGIDEIAKVILPENASQELKNALDNWGVEYETYDGTNEDRLAKLNAVPNVQFSIAQGPDQDVDSFMMGLSEFALPTAQEKTMLRQYKGHKETIKLLEEKIRSREKERDAILAKGRLDPAKQAEIDKLNALVRDARANVEKKQRDMLEQNNKLIQERMAIQKEGRLTNEEKARLKEINQQISLNSDEINGSSYDLSQLIRNTEAQKKAMREDAKVNAFDSKRLSQINTWLQNDRARLNQMQKALVTITGEKGYARMMKNQRNLMNNLVSGQTAADLENTVNAIQANLDNVTREMAERAENLKRLASAEAVLKVRQMFDNRGLKAIAAKLKKDLNSELENKEIENRLALIALKMKEGKYDAETAEELTDLLAGRMQSEYEGYFISELRGSTIVLGQVQLNALKAQNQTIDDVRAKLAGTGIRVSTKGSTTLDSKWDDLCRVFPTLDPKENAGNQLDVLLDKIVKEKEQQPTAYNNEKMMNMNRMVLEAAQKLIPEIIKDENSLKLIRETLAYVAKVSGAAKTTAEAMDDINNLIAQLQKKSDKAIFTAKKLTGDISETIEYFDQLSLQSEAAMWKQERLALIDQLKSENTQNLLKEAEKWKERIAKDKTAREKMGENMQLRKQITTNVSRIRKLLINETDQKNITEHMKTLAREMLGRIVNNDLGGRKITGIAHQDLVEIGRVLNIMDQTENRFTPDDLKLLEDEEVQATVADALADLEDGIAKYNASTGKDVITNLDAFHDALDQISSAVTTISNVISAENRISFLDRNIPIWDAAEDIRKGFEKSRFKGELAGKGRKALGSVKQALYYGNMTPEYFVKNLNNRAFSELWKEAQEGENRNGIELQKAKDYLQELADKTNYKNWANEKKTMQVGGKQTEITIGNMMELYAILTREHTLNPEMSQHILKGGVYFENKLLEEGKLRREKQIQRPVRVTAEEIQAMYDAMTEEQKTYLNSVVSYLSNEMSALGNEASMRMYGIRKYKETYYFPMKVWDGVKSARSDKGITGNNENRAAHKSWSKRRINFASNPLVIGDFTTDAVNHIVEMINYNTMAPAIENINKVLNYKVTENDEDANEIQRNIRIMFQEYYGRDALNYLETLLKDMNGGIAQDQRKTLRDKALSMFKKNAVAGSLSVALQQPLSYIRASMLINPKYLAPGIVANNWKNSYKEMMQYSGVAVIKRMGRFDMNFGQSAKDYITPETKLNLYDKTSDWLTAAPEMMDAMTWTWMWGAVKAETKAKHPGASETSENFMKEVARRFNEVMRRTQVYDSVLVKSSNMRSQNLGMKVLTSFMAEPTLSLNVLTDALRNLGTEGGKKNLGKALATFFISAVFQAGVKGLMGSGRTPDKNKTWLENFLNKFQYNLMNEGNMVSLIPGYSDLIEVLKTGKLQDDAMGAIGKLTTIIETMRKAAEGNGKGAWRDIEDTVGQFAQLFTNIPAKNLMRDARAIYNWIAGTEYAARPTSGAVLKYQRKANWVNGDNLLGTVNAWLGEAGFVTSNKGYYGRIYNAMKTGDQGTASGIKEYLSLAKGAKPETIESGIKSAVKKDDSMTQAEKDSWMIKNVLMGANNTSTITTQYKEGQITAAEAKKLWKQLDPKLTDNVLYWKIDRIDYQKATGADSVSGYNYRLKDAIKGNKSEGIKKAVKDMLDHGRTKDQIKNALSDWKSEYLAADTKGRKDIRDAIQKAYKAMGLTAADADKVINGWTKTKKTKKTK